MKICKCNAKMEYVGWFNNNGRHWCPECGRYTQSYVCEPDVWKTPKIVSENKALTKTGGNDV